MPGENLLRFLERAWVDAGRGPSKLRINKPPLQGFRKLASGTAEAVP